MTIISLHPGLSSLLLSLDVLRKQKPLEKLSSYQEN